MYFTLLFQVEVSHLRRTSTSRSKADSRFPCGNLHAHSLNCAIERWYFGSLGQQSQFVLLFSTVFKLDMSNEFKIRARTTPSKEIDKKLLQLPCVAGCGGASPGMAKSIFH